MIAYKLVEVAWLVNVGPEALTFVYSRFVVDDLCINVFELLRLGQGLPIRNSLWAYEFDQFDCQRIV